MLKKLLLLSALISGLMPFASSGMDQEPVLKAYTPIGYFIDQMLNVPDKKFSIFFTQLDSSLEGWALDTVNPDQFVVIHYKGTPIQLDDKFFGNLLQLYPQKSERIKLVFELVQRKMQQRENLLAFVKAGFDEGVRVAGGTGTDGRPARAKKEEIDFPTAVILVGLAGYITKAFHDWYITGKENSNKAQELWKLIAEATEAAAAQQNSASELLKTCFDKITTELKTVQKYPSINAPNVWFNVADYPFSYSGTKETIVVRIQKAWQLAQDKKGVGVHNQISDFYYKLFELFKQHRNNAAAGSVYKYGRVRTSIELISLIACLAGIKYFFFWWPAQQAG